MTELVRERTRHGVVYTPREVCEPMVRQALAPLVAGRSADEILALRVCDPAIGEGAFLIEIVRVLAEALPGVSDARRRVAERCIHGADIDPRAVATARIAVERFVGTPVRALRDHLITGDALTLAWEPFDALVANPPYIRQELLGASKHALRGYETYDGVADLYVYFVELAHRIVRANGRYCLVVPNKWMTVAYGRRLRDFLARAGSVEGVVDFGRGLFGDADAFPCIVWGTVGMHRGAIRASRAPAGLGIASALSARGIPHPRERWRAGPWHIDTPTDAALIDQIARRWPVLGDLLPAQPSRGIVTGCNRAFVIDGATRARLIAREPAAAELVRPLVKGRDIRRWRPSQIDRHVLLIDRGTDLDELPVVRAHLTQFRTALEPRPVGRPTATWPGRKPGTYRWYELQDPVVPLARSRAPRLFYQDIQSTPACCLDPSGELVPDTTVWIVPSADRFLLALLNSSLYAWYAKRRFPPALGGAVRPKLEYLRVLPVAQPAPELRERIEQLVEAQLTDAHEPRDRELDELILEAYELSRAERARIRAA